MIKPIIIYSLARTKSSAVLQAAQRQHLLHEPFDSWAVLDNSYAGEKLSSVELDNRLLNTLNWPELEARMSASDTAIKFFGTGLHHYYPAQKWFNSVIEKNTHEIFVLLRNLEDTLWSYILALNFGFDRRDHITPFKFAATPEHLGFANRNIVQFLDFYPKNKKIITFDSLPSEYFDRTRITLKPQKSEQKRFLVTNSDYVDDQIQKILLNHKSRWEDVTETNIFTKW
jgi:hypothetical protein